MTLAPGRIWPGTPYRLTISYVSDDGSYVDPTTVTLYLLSPAGVQTSYVYGTDSEMGRSDTGRYYADVTPDTGGRWHWRWLTTGDGTTIAHEGDMLVQRSPFVDGLDTQAYRR